MPKRAEHERHQPDRAQQVLRALAEAGQKLHRHQVQKTLDDSGSVRISSGRAAAGDG